MLSRKALTSAFRSPISRFYPTIASVTFEIGVVESNSNTSRTLLAIPLIEYI
jgi:hypothetical protein